MQLVGLANRPRSADEVDPHALAGSRMPASQLTVAPHPQVGGTSTSRVAPRRWSVTRLPASEAQGAGRKWLSRLHHMRAERRRAATRAGSAASCG